MQKESSEEHTIVFKYKRNHHHTPLQEIMICEKPRKNIKLDPSSLSLEDMFCQLALSNHQPQQMFVLTRINPEQLSQQDPAEELSSQKTFLKDIHSIADKNSHYLRQERKRQIFNLFRKKAEKQQATQEVIAGRNIKVVTFDSKKIHGKKVAKEKKSVNLGGERIEYEDMQEEQVEEFYLLEKRSVGMEEELPMMSMPEEGQHLVQFEDEEVLNDSMEHSSDSNREDHPDYDYPDEEDHHSRSSEDLIESDQATKHRFAHDQGIDSDSFNQLDDEELYRKYLKRCRNKEQEMDLDGPLQDYE